MIDDIIYETCEDCKRRRGEVSMIYTRYESETLCKICYIKMLRDIISRYSDRSIIDLVKWINILTRDIEFINI